MYEREALFGKYLEITGFNAEPVLLTYPDNQTLNKLIDTYRNTRAEYEFTTNKKRTHHFWPISNNDDIATITKVFGDMPAVYIADGHHRCASSCYLADYHRKNNPNHTETADYNFFMSYLIAESNLKISAFNRFIKTLNGLSKETFLLKLDTHFRIENRGKSYYEPSKKHHFSMYLDGEFYSLYLRKSVYEIKTPLDDLDAQLLYETVLKPILGIEDLSNNSKISYKPAIHSKLNLKVDVDNGKYKVAFGMFPATVAQLKSVADTKLTMPPKSTYIEPKLRSGLTIYEF